MKMDKALHITCVFGIVIAFLSPQAFSQHKVEKPMTDQQKSQDTIKVTAEGLKVTQSGSGNHVEVNQSAEGTFVITNRKTTIIEQNGNRVIYSGDADSTNHTQVHQSGSGNRAVVRQSGGGNSVRVRQVPEKKKED